MVMGKYYKIVRTSIFIFLLFYLSISNGQTQVVRGIVTDTHSGLPLQYVAVEVFGEENFGTETNIKGNFVLKNIPVGRITIVFSSVDKESYILDNLELLGSKELVLEISLEDKIERLETVEISSSSIQNGKPSNKHALVSARGVGIEEVHKYAGTLNDVARMVMNYAGVKETDDSKNDIVIRGNSSRGLLWRLNDVDIPNPNHFGSSGATGGPVNMINSNLLANSDFFTGAFTPEYSNAISGVFDLKMRKGNLYEHEFIGQVGLNGFEFLAEGPIKKETSSFVVSYRYSFLDILSNLGIDFGTGTAIPEYQDISFNTYFSVKEKGQFSIFGMGGKSQIHIFEDDGSFYSEDETKSNSKSGFIALQYRHQWSGKTFSKTTLSYSAIHSGDVLSDPSMDDEITYKSDFRLHTLELATYIKTKLNTSSNLKTGFRLKQKKIDYLEYEGITGRYDILSDLNANYYLAQGYLSYFKKINKKWTTVFGFSSLYFEANKNVTFEPRFSLEYSPNKQQNINFGYGFHTQTPDIKYLVYYDIDKKIYPNQNLDFIKSHHLVLGYNFVTKQKVRFKIEGYYQYITNATIAGEAFNYEDQGFSEVYSTLNDNSFTNRDALLRTPQNLKDGGKGRNYGLEFTVEKQLEKGFYFLSTLSLFESKYRAKDLAWRNTAFNGNYVYNILAGKEWFLNKKMRLSVDAKMVYAGGLREIPIDSEKSNIYGDLEYDYVNAYVPQIADYFRADIRAGLKLDLKKVSQEWAFEIKNITGRQNEFNSDYDPVNNVITKEYQLGIFPVFLYRIFF